jgi:hypothetical protein
MRVQGSGFRVQGSQVLGKREKEERVPEET